MATDVAARGLDIKELSAVINYEFLILKFMFIVLVEQVVQVTKG